MSPKVKAQQDWKTTISGTVSEMTVRIFNLDSELEIIGHSSNEVILKTTEYRGIPEKAKGLKPLSAYGEDNTNIGLYYNVKGNTVEISGASRSANDGEYTIRIPQNIKLKIESDGWNSDNIRVTGMDNEIEIKANSADIELVKVSGPLVLHSMNGEIEVDFSQLSQKTPTSINSTNGDIDISLPASSKANFRMSCLNGEIYTDLNINMDEGDGKNLNRIGGGMKARGSIGGGGVEVSLMGLNGNIYLRKK